MKCELIVIILVLICHRSTTSAVSCVIRIGEKDESNKTIHRRMVLFDDLTQGCENSDVILINISHDNVERTFTKVKATLRREKSSSISSPFSYWVGEDTIDGSVFNFVKDSEGHMSGSMVDLTNHNVLQFFNKNGSYMVTITHSSEFDPELDPDNDDRRRLAIGRGEPGKNDINIKLQNRPQKKIDPIRKDQIHPPQTEDRRKLYDDNGGNLDVMVVWTMASECEAFGLPIGCSLSRDSEWNMLALINLAIEETNNAFESSGVDTELLLVHAYRHPSYSEFSSDPFRDSLYNLAQGNIQDVHSNRELYGADIVSLIIFDGNACGVGYIGPHIEAMFSVAAWNCATGYYSFGHEIAHNLGCNHDRGTSAACDSKGYNYGYRDPNAYFRTVLAYNCVSGQCDNNTGGGCSRIPRFSNPDLTFSGLAIGSSIIDNARTINNSRVEVAGYFKHVSSPQTPTPSPQAMQSSTGSECNDSAFRFRIIKGTERILRNCEWVGNKDTKRRCDLSGVSSMCPQTCGTCSLCVDGENRMKFGWNDRTIARDCKWVKNKQTIKRCQIDGMKDICRATCGSC